MRRSANEINKTRIPISKSKLEQNNLTYVKAYSDACYKLYDLGYISTPSTFIEDEFFNVLLDEFKGIIYKCMLGNSKKLIKEPEYLEYISKVIGDKEFSKIISLYCNILKSSQAFNDYSILTNKVKLKKRSDITEVKVRLSAMASVKNENNIPLDSPYIQDAFAVEDGYEIVDLDLRFIWLKYICKELGIPMEYYDKCKETNKSIFDKNLTFEDDCRYIKYYISGDIISEGEYSDKLRNYACNFYVSFVLADYSNFLEKIFIEAKDEMNAYVDEYRDSLKPLDVKDYYITNFNVYFKVKSSVNKEKDYNEANYSLGHYIYDNFNKKNLDFGNLLCGLSGEFISETNIDSNVYDILGFPVVLTNFTSHGSAVRTNYYPIFNIKKKNGGEFYPYYGFGKELECFEKSGVLKIFNLNSLEDIKDKVRNELVGVNEHDKEVIGNSLYALIRESCGESNQDLHFLSNISLDNFDTVLFNTGKYYKMLAESVK